MARLINRYDLRLDSKGRLVLPAVHRSRYEAGVVLSAKTDHVAIYEPAAWDEFVAGLTEARRDGRITREAFNLILMQAADPVPDAAGRVLLPSWMREQFGLEADVVIGGNGEYLGIYPGGYFDTIDPAFAREAAATADRLGL